MESLNQTNQEFSIGSPVVYGLLGKCNVTGIETRTVGGASIRFYKLEIQKPALSRSTKHDPAIWLPIEASQAKGLRAPANASDLDHVNKLLSTPEYYFNATEHWSTIYPQLENAIKNEGFNGLAKVYSFLFVLKRKMIVASSEINKFNETITRIFYREISDLTGETAKQIEERLNKIMRPKLLPDH